MFSTVVVVLTLLSSTLTHPITSQDNVTSDIEGVPQIQGGISLPQQMQKTGVQSSSEVIPQSQINETEESTVHLSTLEQYTKVNTAQQVSQTGAQISPNVLVSPQYAAVPKVENIPVNVQAAQTSNTENPVLLPFQPLSVVPASQAGQVVQPVVVPIETIPVERMIIMGTDSFQQRDFQQDVSNIPESQVSNQQVVQPVSYTQVLTQNVEPNQQPNYVTPVETPEQSYSPVRVQPNLTPLVKEQVFPVIQTAQQFVVPSSDYNPTPVEASAQVYNAQYSEQSVDAEDAKKQASTNFNRVQTQFVEPSVQQQQEQQHYVQHSVEKQVPYQQGSIQSQTSFVKPTGFENIVKQVPNQQYSDVQTQNVEHNYQHQQDHNSQQAAKNQVPYQQVNSYTPVQNQPAGQSVYYEQPVPVEKTENVGQYQEKYSPVQIQSAESQQQQVQSVQQVIEKQGPYQQPVAVQTYAEQPVNQVVQSVGQVENQVQYQKGSQFPNVGYFLGKAPENSEFEPNEQVFNVQPQQPAQYTNEYTHSFEDKTSQVQQNSPVQALTSVPQSQVYSVQPSVGSA